MRFDPLRFATQVVEAIRLPAPALTWATERERGPWSEGIARRRLWSSLNDDAPVEESRMKAVIVVLARASLRKRIRLPALSWRQKAHCVDLTTVRVERVRAPGDVVRDRVVVDERDPGADRNRDRRGINTIRGDRDTRRNGGRCRCGARGRRGRRSGRRRRRRHGTF